MGYNTFRRMVMKMTIGQRIKNRRIELNLSVDEVAEKLNKNRATIYRYEKDDIKELPITVLEPLAKVLETTPADLMGWDAPDSQPNQDIDLTIIQRERSKMSSKEKTKLMNILKANFDDYNWEDDDSGDIE